METPSSSRRLPYLLFAFASFAVMALVWSLEDTLVYLFAGLGAWFVFLYYWNRPRAPKVSVRKNEPKSDQFADEILKDLFRDEKPSSSDAQNRTVFAIVSIVFFCVLLILGLFFSFEDGASESNSEATPYDVAEQFRLAGQYDSADRYYIRSIESNHEDTQARVAYGISLMSQKRNEEAIRVFNEVLTIDPENPHARFNTGIVFYNQKQYTPSLKQALRLIREKPDFSPSRLLAGDIYYAQQRYDSALYWYEQAYEMGEENADLTHYMAYMYDLKQDTEQAVHFYHLTVRLDSSRYQIYERLSEFYPGPEGDPYRSMAKRWKKSSK